MENPFANISAPQADNTIELPVQTNLVMRTATLGKAAPSIKDRNGIPFMVKTGLTLVGGTHQVDQRLYGRYAFFSSFVRPQGELVTQEDYSKIAGRLMGFMGATLHPQVQDREERERLVLSTLGVHARKLAEDNILTSNMFQVTDDIVDLAGYLATTFVLYLAENPKLLIVTLDYGKEWGNPPRKDIEVKAYRAATEENLEKNLVTIFPNKEGIVEYQAVSATPTGVEDIDFS